VPSVVFRGPIDEVQPLGGESLIHFNASGAAMTAKVPSQTAWQRGQRATFTADPARLHWFAADGRRIA
jgi:ABC-type sugar transport system ATPase subunit